MRPAISNASTIQHCCCSFPGCAKCIEWNQQIKPLNNESSSTNSSSSSSAAISSNGPNKYFKGLIILALSGICLVCVSYVTYIIDPQDLAIKIVLTMSDGSFIFRLWQKPPVPVYLKVYIFNVTNPEEFLRGEQKLRLQEVGPYIYREVLEHQNVRFNDNGTVTYTPKRHAEPSEHLLAETAAGRGLEDHLVIPNIPLLGISSKLADYPMIAQMGFSSLVNLVNSQPFDKVTVREYLWGYDDPIVRLANMALSDWVTFERLGLLDRMFDVGTDVVTMDIASFSISRYNGKTFLRDGFRTADLDVAPPKCRESLKGVSEGVLFPRNVPKKPVTVYRKAFCRTLAIEYEREEPEELANGVPGGMRFGIPGHVFNASQTPEHGCHCGKIDEKSPCRLVPGLSDITSCYYGIPAAASFPHFYLGDPSLLAKVDGLSPIPEKHEPYVVIQKKLGVPIAGHMRMQTNLVLRRNKYVKRISKFGDMILPIVWTDLTFEEIPPKFQWMLNLCLKIAPPVQYGFIYGAASLGFSFLLAAVLGYTCHSTQHKHREQGESPLPTRRDSGYHLVQVLTADDLVVSKDYSVAL